MPLKIAARLPLPYKDDVNGRADRAYYKTQVQPLLDSPGVELIGPVGGAEKNDFLRHAAALLFPIQWPEPFGLVMAAYVVAECYPELSVFTFGRGERMIYPTSTEPSQP
jgi:glycosyltransferase involved in cell wall biosynthesis